MSTFDDDDIEFDFFDEPETVEATQRRRLPRIERQRQGGRPPRTPMTPGGVTPLLRLVGLVALMIFIVVVLVFWARSCQGASKHSSYQHYMDHVTVIAHESQRVGQQFSSMVTTPGTTKPSAFSEKVRGLASQAASQVADAETLHPPGPLRSVHQHLVDTLQLRQSGLARFADAIDQTASERDASQAAPKLVDQGQLLAASDVDWDYFFYEGAVQTLQSQHVTGVAVPHSQFLTNPELVGPDSMVRLFGSLHGSGSGSSSSAGTNCPCGDALVSVKVLPAGTELSTSTPTTIKSSAQLAFQVTVQNSGNSQNVGVPVKLTIGTLKPLVETIDLISPSQQKTVTFSNLPANLPFGPEVKITATVGPVPGESKLDNNTATYSVFFSV